MKKIIALTSILASLTISCDTEPVKPTINQNFIYNTSSSLSFSKIGSFQNGNDVGYSEISAFDPATKKLFVVNPAESEVSVIDLTTPSSPNKLTSIKLNGTPNSVAVNDKILAVALENVNKQANGTIETFNTETQTLIKSYPAGALPDMVTFSPNGKYIISANEGEPSNDYTNDPEGSITIVDLTNKTETQVTFAGLTNPGNDFRVFGNNGKATLQQDVEPEYVAVSNDSKYAFVTLQENNGLAKVNLDSKAIESIVGLGTKDFNKPENKFDVSNKDGIIGNFKNWNVLSYYMPDAIDYTEIDGTGYLITANEGDSRDYKGYSEEERVADLKLDPTKYPNASELQKDENLGRLKITTANGDTDNDGDYDQIYGYGGRSFSIWDTNGQLLYDSGNEISLRTFNISPSTFNNDEGKADGRSDDKGAEPETVKTLKIEDKTLLFVGLERTGGVMVYDISYPKHPQFIAWLNDSSDISPEGITVVEKADSPTGNYLMIVTNEVSSTIAIYEIK